MLYTSAANLGLQISLCRGLYIQRLSSERPMLGNVLNIEFPEWKSRGTNRFFQVPGCANLTKSKLL